MASNKIRPPAAVAKGVLQRRRVPVWDVFPETPNHLHISPHRSFEFKRSTDTIIRTVPRAQAQWYSYSGEESRPENTHINTSEWAVGSEASHPTTHSGSFERAPGSQEHRQSSDPCSYSSPGAGSVTRGKSPYLSLYPATGHTGDSQPGPSKRPRSWASWMLQSNKSWAPDLQSASSKQSHSSKSPSTTSSAFAEAFKLERALGWLSSLPSPEPSPSVVNKQQQPSNDSLRHGAPSSFETIALPSPVYLGEGVSSAAASARTLYLPPFYGDPATPPSPNLHAEPRRVLPPPRRKWHLASLPRLAKEYIQCHMRQLTPSYISENLGPQLISPYSSSSSIVVVGARDAISTNQIPTTEPGLQDSANRETNLPTLSSKNTPRSDSAFEVSGSAEKVLSNTTSTAQNKHINGILQSDAAIPDHASSPPNPSLGGYTMQMSQDYTKPSTKCTHSGADAGAYVPPLEDLPLGGRIARRHPGPEVSGTSGPILGEITSRGSPRSPHQGSPALGAGMGARNSLFPALPTPSHESTMRGRLESDRANSRSGSSRVLGSSLILGTSEARTLDWLLHWEGSRPSQWVLASPESSSGDVEVTAGENLPGDHSGSSTDAAAVPATPPRSHLPRVRRTAAWSDPRPGPPPPLWPEVRRRPGFLERPGSAASVPATMPSDLFGRSSPVSRLVPQPLTLASSPLPGPLCPVDPSIMFGVWERMEEGGLQGPPFPAAGSGSGDANPRFRVSPPRSSDVSFKTIGSRLRRWWKNRSWSIASLGSRLSVSTPSWHWPGPSPERTPPESVSTLAFSSSGGGPSSSGAAGGDDGAQRHRHHHHPRLTRGRVRLHNALDAVASLPGRLQPSAIALLTALGAVARFVARLPAYVARALGDDIPNAWRRRWRWASFLQFWQDQMEHGYVEGTIQVFLWACPSLLCGSPFCCCNPE